MPRFALVVIAVLAAACATDVMVESSFDHADGEVIELTGAALERELSESPAHRAGAPFARVGLVWDADRPGALELATSADGTTWSAWRAPEVNHTEVEERASFVGQLAVDGERARHVRLRRGDGAPTFVRLELLPTPLSDAIEDREEPAGGSPYAFPVGAASVQSRAEWNARASQCSAALGPVTRMAIHHTETPTDDTMSPEARLRQIQSYHMDVNGWCDVGYHYLVSRDGRAWEGRPAARLGAHAGGANTGNLGIAIVGRHDTTPITGEQVESLAALVRGLADRHGVAVTRTAIKGHRQYGSTTCPGDALQAQLDAVVARAAAGPMAPPPPPGGTVTVKGVLYAGADPSARIADATVQLGARSVVTSATGLWTFTGVPEGAFTVTASKVGYQTTSITRTTYAAESWASFGLPPAGGPAAGTAILQGVVYQTEDTSQRIAGVTIALSIAGRTATTDGNGVYRFTDLPAGPVTITASKPGFPTRTIERVLVDGATAWGSVRLDAAPPPPSPPPPAGPWRPAPGTTWQWQLSGTLDTSIAAAVYDVDLFTTSAAQIAGLKTAGKKVICYFSAGSYEPDRPDSAQFPASVKGSVLDGWPDERWLDIRSAVVRELMRARIALARSKGCDAVEPDNVDAFDNASGFGLTAAHQVDFNRFLAAEAHAQGLSIGLKNALALIPQLVGDFDWALNEECYTYDECSAMTPFVSAGKAVFHAEYVAASSAAAVCNVTRPLGLSTIIKRLDLDAWRVTCP